MHRTYLVQRLERPYENDWQRRVGHAFGGESKINMSEEGFKTVEGIFSFSYMGAAEYEFGAVTNCLHNLAKDSEALVSFQMTLRPKEIKPNWQKQHAHDMARRKLLKECKEKGIKPPRAKKLIPDIPERTIYVLCRKHHEADVREVIKEMALDKVHTKNGNNFAVALDPQTDHDKRTVGWLEINNGWFAFIDETMWRKTCALFQGGDEKETHEESRGSGGEGHPSGQEARGGE